MYIIDRQVNGVVLQAVFRNEINWAAGTSCAGAGGASLCGGAAGAGSSQGGGASEVTGGSSGRGGSSSSAEAVASALGGSTD